MQPALESNVQIRDASVRPGWRPLLHSLYATVEAFHIFWRRFVEDLKALPVECHGSPNAEVPACYYC